MPARHVFGSVNTLAIPAWWLLCYQMHHPMNVVVTPRRCQKGRVIDLSKDIVNTYLNAIGCRHPLLQATCRLAVRLSMTLARSLFRQPRDDGNALLPVPILRSKG
ncbi:hypothetical protein ASPTUDRAFT_609125 [Aspergillus tubingensis CBS 134.48]|uniref:Uncharacterized protein n=1 Tax=Aspergillus tubingensis (strain CBS 134.48) TaxID=767770 RepID=A0A1L9N2N7_ASPTC|nr:hypothetical protein ASPTUDRAFT_609125 [Aspergillus tubingensis CBS 134.48]